MRSFCRFLSPLLIAGITLITNSALSETKLPPDGLCLLFKVKADNLLPYGGHGHGFILNNQVVAPAHVLKEGIAKIFCFQDGILTDVTPVKSGIVIFDEHEKYNTEMKYAFDIGVVSLGRNIKSDFRILPSSSISETIVAHESIAGPNLFHSIQENESNEEFNALLNAKTPVQFSVHTQDFRNEKFKLGIQTSYVDLIGKTQRLENEGTDKANVFVAYGFHPRGGLSGMPFVEAQDGLQYVVGMLVTGKAREFGVFVPAHVIYSMTHPSASLLIEKSCSDVLGSSESTAK